MGEFFFSVELKKNLLPLHGAHVPQIKNHWVISSYQSQKPNLGWQTEVIYNIL